MFKYCLLHIIKTWHASQLGQGLLCFNAGMKQSGVPLGDVVLPAWAKGDSREFIRAHREVGKTLNFMIFVYLNFFLEFGHCILLFK
jgi:hypothetical protein